MNYPLDTSAALDNVAALRRALETCDGYTLSIRVALSACLHDYHNGFRSAEASLAIAAAKITCTPQPRQRRYAYTYRQDVTSLPGYTPKLAVAYSQLCFDAITKIIGGLRASRNRELRAHYEIALAIETEQLASLTSALVPA